MTKSFNQQIESEFSLDVFYMGSGSLSQPAVRKRIRKLVRLGLIKNVDLKSMTKKILFDANLRRAKLFGITEYGLFYMLSLVVEYQPPDLFWRYWRYKVMRVLLSSYFEKKTVLQPGTAMYFAIARFLMEACNITTRRLSEIEEAIKENDETERREQTIEIAR